MSVKYKTFVMCDACSRPHVGVTMDKPSAMFAKLGAESNEWLIVRGKEGKPAQQYCPECAVLFKKGFEL